MIIVERDVFIIITMYIRYGCSLAWLCPTTPMTSEVSGKYVLKQSFSTSTVIWLNMRSVDYTRLFSQTVGKDGNTSFPVRKVDLLLP